VKWEALTFGIALEDLRERFKENLDVVLNAWKEPKLDHAAGFTITMTCTFGRDRCKSHIRRCGWRRPPL
jgi:alkanesulfonate monooxygenase SsuD/methylene tetrahydromethanopterin reductase-like flavin-dependent oxidoreductase (luciferase family)